MRKQQLSPEDARIVTWFGKEAGAKFFILTSDIEEIRKRLVERGTEDQRVLDKLEWINERFLYFADMFDLPVIDTSKLTLGEIFKLVEQPSKPFTFIH